MAKGETRIVQHQRSRRVGQALQPMGRMRFITFVLIGNHVVSWVTKVPMHLERKNNGAQCICALCIHFYWASLVGGLVADSVLSRNLKSRETRGWVLIQAWALPWYFTVLILQKKTKKQHLICKLWHQDIKKTNYVLAKKKYWKVEMHWQYSSQILTMKTNSTRSDMWKNVSNKSYVFFVTATRTLIQNHFTNEKVCCKWSETKQI